jgi:hypothetical protein
MDAEEVGIRAGRWRAGFQGRGGVSSGRLQCACRSFTRGFLQFRRTPEIDANARRKSTSKRFAAALQRA